MGEENRNIEKEEDSIGKKDYNDLLKRYSKLLEIHNSTNESMKRVEEENKALHKKHYIMLAEQDQWVREKENQELIIRKTVDSFNDERKDLNEEIQRLRGIIKTFKDK